MKKESRYNKQIFKSGGSNQVLFFGCPFGTKINLLKAFISSLNKDGYTVVAYDFNNDVFYKGDLNYLGSLIEEVVSDVKQSINDFKKAGISNFGFFGTSLGGLVLYNAVAVVPELKWGVFNAGGEAAGAVWKISKMHKAFALNGHTLSDLRKAWTNIQYPEFDHDLEENHYVYVGSMYDKVVPIQKASEYIKGMIEKGARLELINVKGLGHNHTALIGLARSRKLLQLVNPETIVKKRLKK